MMKLLVAISAAIALTSAATAQIGLPPAGTTSPGAVESNSSPDDIKPTEKNREITAAEAFLKCEEGRLSLTCYYELVLSSPGTGAAFIADKKLRNGLDVADTATASPRPSAAGEARESSNWRTDHESEFQQWLNDRGPKAFRPVPTRRGRR